MGIAPRRNFFFASSGAAAGALLAPGLLEGQEPAPAKLDWSASGLATGAPKPLKHKEIPGFLNAAQIAPHHTAHYGGALMAFTGIDAKFEQSYRAGTALDPHAFEAMQKLKSSRGNSVLLHELYFDGLAPKTEGAGPGLRPALEKRFGSFDQWAADFVATAKAAAGWAMVVVHPANGRLYNVLSDEHAIGPLWLAVPLVVIDTYEHAFYIDYQNRKAEYVEKFLKHIDWAEAERRYRSVVVA